MNAVKKFLLLAVFLLAGCAGLHDPAKPTNQQRMFPVRNQDATLGLIVNRGTAPMNLYVYDQANRLVEQTYMSGANRFITVQGQTYPQYFERKVEPGCYRIEAFPFYQKIVWIAMSEVRVDLPKQIYSFCTGNNPTAYYYSGRHWGWLLYVGTNIPDGGDGLPLFQVNLFN